jgi:hypothetical protein
MADADSIPALYDAFNARDVDAVVAALAPGVRWPNGWEGGFVHGHDEVRDYWRRQWAEIDPHVEPVAIDERLDGSVSVRVHQVVRDLAGTKVAEGEVVHVYRFENGLVVEMTIEEA